MFPVPSLLLESRLSYRQCRTRGWGWEPEPQHCVHCVFGLWNQVFHGNQQDARRPSWNQHEVPFAPPTI
jgi:hypothetical protein